MQLTDDHALLKSYTREGSQEAFARLVDRHVNLVYSAARRIVGSESLAEDITQEVFTRLARKAGGLDEATVMAGWLYRAARHVASETLRREGRRRRREQMAAEAMHSLDSNSAWQHIESLVDEAMGGLQASDHDALVLRYFENRSLREVGLAFGCSEDAAQKRVTRALDRLRHTLARQGAAIPVATLAVALTSAAVQSAPAGLAASTAAGSLLAVNATGLIPGLFSTMATTKLKLVAVTAVAGILTIGLVAVSRQNAALRHEVKAWRAAAAQRADTSAASGVAAESGAPSDELQRLRREHLEVLGLRGRVGQLADELRRLKGEAGQVRATTNASPADADSILFTAASTNRVYSGQTLVIGGWLKDGMRGYLVLRPVIQESDVPGEASRLAIQSQIVGAPEKFWNEIGWGSYKSDARRSTLAGVLTTEQAEALLAALRETTDGELTNTSSVTNRDGEPFAFSWAMDDEQGAGVMMNITLHSRIAADGRSVDLELLPASVSPDKIHSSLSNAARANPQP